MHKVFQYLLARAKILLLIVTALILVFCRDTSLNNTSSVMPQITIEDLGLCEPYDSEWTFVSEFGVNSKQYFCAQMKSDVSPVRLTLIIQKNGSIYSVEYSDANEFTEGFIFFQVKPGLPPGDYVARILYARQTLGEIEFDVTDK